VKGKRNLPYFFIVLGAWVAITSCEKPKEGKDTDMVKDREGRIIDGIDRQFTGNGTLLKEIPYKDGQLDGTVKVYFETGELKTEVHYEKGRREGFARRYYKEGPLYQDAFYHNGKLDGIQRKYHQNGQLMSESIMYKGKPCVGLREYYTSGKEKQMPFIQFEKVDSLSINGYYALHMNMSDGSKNVTFYFGKLNEDGCLTEHLIPIMTENGTGVIHFFLEPGEMVTQDFDIVARNITTLRNTQILSASYKLSVKNNGR